MEKVVSKSALVILILSINSPLPLRISKLIIALFLSHNIGMQDRHWKILSEELGKEIAPDDRTSLQNMLDLGIRDILPKLEEVSLAATKEAELSANLNKMVTEWTDIKLDVVPYRDTGKNNESVFT